MIHVITASNDIGLNRVSRADYIWDFSKIDQSMKKGKILSFSNKNAKTGPDRFHSQILAVAALKAPQPKFFLAVATLEAPQPNFILAVAAL